MRQTKCNARQRIRQQQSEDERQQRLLARRERERSVNQHESEKRRQKKLLAQCESERSVRQHETATTTKVSQSTIAMLTQNVVWFK